MHVFDIVKKYFDDNKTDYEVVYSYHCSCSIKEFLNYLCVFCGDCRFGYKHICSICCREFYSSNKNNSVCDLCKYNDDSNIKQ